MGKITNSFVALAVCFALGAAQPVKDDLPTLKEVPAEVIFKPDGSKPLILECAVTASGKKIKYSWHKNGQPLQLNSGVTQRANEGSLVFQKPKADDEGVYQCFAESDLGVASTRPISVKKTYINLKKSAPATPHKPVNGRSYKLDCPVPDAYPKPTISWMRQKADSDKLEEITGRHIIEGPDGVLYFNNVTQIDVYKYSCLVESPALDKKEVIAKHDIVEVIPDKQPNNGDMVPQYLSNEVMAKAGEVTMIYCIYGGSPFPFPSWYVGKTEIGDNPKDRITRRNRSSGKRLLFKDTYLSDAGTYTCKVDNGVGKPQKHDIHLTVVSAPKALITAEPVIHATEGQDVTIPCQVTGVNTPKLSWTYNAKPLSESGRLSVNKAGSKDGETAADLTIKKVQKGDTGYYQCKAVNDHGDLYTETLLYVA